jgi:hypothetical protein
MQKFGLVKSKYLTFGVSEDNIDYAIESVIEGTKQELILETLTADYRGMSGNQAAQLLQDLYVVNGGEFKKENRGGYLYGTLLSLVGLAGAGFFITMLISGEGKIKFMALAFAGAAFGLSKGPILIIKSLRGKFRDNDDPFNEQ